MWELEKSLHEMCLGLLYCEHASSRKYEQIRDKDLNKNGQRGVMGTHESRKSGQAGNQNRDARTT